MGRWARRTGRAAPLARPVPAPARRAGTVPINTAGFADSWQLASARANITYVSPRSCACTASGATGPHRDLAGRSVLPQRVRGPSGRTAPLGSHLISNAGHAVESPCTDQRCAHH